jgi:hypothetical protein
MGLAQRALGQRRALQAGAAPVGDRRPDRATAALGTPITGGRPNGSISIENASGKASLNFPVSGPKGSGTAFVEAVKKDGVWSLTRLAFKPDGSDKVIEIIGGARNST